MATRDGSVLRVVSVHDGPQAEQLAERLRHADGWATATAPDVAAAERQHASRPFDVVLAELDDTAAVVRQVRAWHPVPAVVTVGPEDHDAVDVALVSGAHDHVTPDAGPAQLQRVVDRSWRRHRAARTRRAENPPAPNMHDVRRRVSQLVSLAAAAGELLDIDGSPHTTVRSLLDQACEIGQETVHLTGRPRSDDVRGPLDLDALVRSAWGARTPRGTELQVQLDEVEVHGHTRMVRTALIVLFAHALRGPDRAQTVLVDTELLPTSLLLRVHDDGPVVAATDRRRLFGTETDETTPVLMTVEHVAARHGGTAWLADSDRVADGVMAVLELPRRATER